MNTRSNLHNNLVDDTTSQTTQGERDELDIREIREAIEDVFAYTLRDDPYNISLDKDIGYSYRVPSEFTPEEFFSGMMQLTGRAIYLYGPKFKQYLHGLKFIQIQVEKRKMRQDQQWVEIQPWTWPDILKQMCEYLLEEFDVDEVVFKYYDIRPSVDSLQMVTMASKKRDVPEIGQDLRYILTKTMEVKNDYRPKERSESN